MDADASAAFWQQARDLRLPWFAQGLAQGQDFVALVGAWRECTFRRGRHLDRLARRAAGSGPRPEMRRRRSACAAPPRPWAATPVCLCQRLSASPQRLFPAADALRRWPHKCWQCTSASKPSLTRPASLTPAACTRRCRPSTPSHAMQTHLAPQFENTPRGRRRKPSCANACIAALYRHLPDLPTAGRRAGRPTRAHLPHQTSARRRTCHAQHPDAPGPLPDLPQLRALAPAACNTTRWT